MKFLSGFRKWSRVSYIAAALAAGAEAQAAGFEGEIVTVDFTLGGVPFPGLSFTTDPIDAAPNTPEISGFAGFDFDFVIDFSTFTIVLTSNEEILAGDIENSFGFLFTDPFGSQPQGFSNIVDVTVSASDFSVFDSTVTSSDNEIFVDLFGINVAPGDSLVLSVDFAETSVNPIPLPMTMPLLLGAAGALAAVARRRRA